jgi:hypothetical protein
MRRAVSIVAVAMLAFGTFPVASADAPVNGPSAPPFDSRALRSYRLAGGASITGTLEVSVAGSSTPTAAIRSRVVAIPDSNYTRWWFQSADAALAQQTGPFADPPDDPKLRPFQRVAFTDEAGNFRFDGLPAGAYRVRGRVVATFDRTVQTPHDVKLRGVDGSPIVATEVSTVTYHDRSAFWLESGRVLLRPGESRAISLHVAVRRNTYGRR